MNLNSVTFAQHKFQQRRNVNVLNLTEFLHSGWEFTESQLEPVSVI